MFHLVFDYFGTVVQIVLGGEQRPAGYCAVNVDGYLVDSAYQAV